MRATGRKVWLVTAAFVAVTLISSRESTAQVDVTVFVGAAYPIYDERLTLRPSTPSLPGAEISVTGDPSVSADGGLVFGGALAFEAGVFGIEGRLDSTAIGFDLTGARYDIRTTTGPVAGLTGAITIGDARLDANRLQLLSLNLRLRTPGPISLVASGGVSLLPNVDISGSVPLTVQIAGLPPLPGVQPEIRLTAAPGEADHRFGVNGGVGLRIGGGNVAVIGEVRGFYFREYVLGFDAEGAPDIVIDLLEGLEPVRFEPIIVNAQVGLTIKF